METIKVIKIGGNIINDENALDGFLDTFSKIEGKKILVHGGGKMASELAKKLHIPIKMNEGRRITDAPTLDIITMVYAGKINTSIVAKLQAKKCNAIGLSGADANTIEAIKRPVKNLDYGFVGDITQVNTEAISEFLNTKKTPVFCAITHQNGQLLNTNADTIASKIAIGFAKNHHVELYYCFEKNGVLKNMNDETSIIKWIDNSSYKNLIKEGIIKEGMLPKLNNCIHAVNQNVKKVCIGKHDSFFNTKNTHTTIVK